MTCGDCRGVCCKNQSLVIGPCDQTEMEYNDGNIFDTSFCIALYQTEILYLKHYVYIFYETLFCTPFSH